MACITCVLSTPSLPSTLRVTHVGEKSTTDLDEIDIGELTEAQLEAVIQDWGDALRKYHQELQKNVPNILMR